MYYTGALKLIPYFTSLFVFYIGALLIQYFTYLSLYYIGALLIPYSTSLYYEGVLLMQYLMILFHDYKGTFLNPYFTTYVFYRRGAYPVFPVYLYYTGAFLIPYFTSLLLCGMPLFCLELCVAQFSGLSPLQIWSICPLFKGKHVDKTFLC